MFLKLADNSSAGSLADKLRKKRYELFMSLITGLPKPLTILDVGGTERYWKSMGLSENSGIQIVLLNLKELPSTMANIECKVGNATYMGEFRDGEFEVVYSNSVIEHLFTLESQRKMANEILRVGKRYFIQTPNRYFPIEPHFHVPFFQFYPLAMKKYLISHFGLGFFNRKEQESAGVERLAREIRLLSKREYGRLFPQAEIYEEKIMGLTKSFVAYGGWEA